MDVLTRILGASTLAVAGFGAFETKQVRPGPDRQWHSAVRCDLGAQRHCLKHMPDDLQNDCEMTTGKMLVTTEEFRKHRNEQYDIREQKGLEGKNILDLDKVKKTISTTDSSTKEVDEEQSYQ